MIPRLIPMVRIAESTSIVFRMESRLLFGWCLRVQCKRCTCIGVHKNIFTICGVHKGRIHNSSGMFVHSVLLAYQVKIVSEKQLRIIFFRGRLILRFFAVGIQSAKITRREALKVYDFIAFRNNKKWPPKKPLSTVLTMFEKPSQ